MQRHLRFSGLTSIRAAGLAAALLVAAGLSGCGRRGPLEAPPDPSVAAPAGAASTVVVGHRAKAVPIEHPKGSFVLDPLL